VAEKHTCSVLVETLALVWLLLRPVLAAGSRQSTWRLAKHERGQAKAELPSKSLNLWDGSVAAAEMKMPRDLCPHLSWLLGRIKKLSINVVPTDLSC